MSKPARDDEKMSAYDLFCKGVSIKDIAKTIRRKEHTIAAWRDEGDWNTRRDGVRKEAMKQLDEKNVEFNARRQQELEAAVQSVLKELPDAVIKSKEGALSSVVHATKEQRELRGMATQGITLILDFSGMNRPPKERWLSQTQLDTPADVILSESEN